MCLPFAELGLAPGLAITEMPQQNLIDGRVGANRGAYFWERCRKIGGMPQRYRSVTVLGGL